MLTQELKGHLRSPYSIGFIGGRVNHALYFTGYSQRTSVTGAVDAAGELVQQQSFLGLDPHTCYPTPLYNDVKDYSTSSSAATQPPSSNNNNYTHININSTFNLSSTTTTNTDTNNRTTNNITNNNNTFPSLNLLNQLHVDKFEEVDVKSLDPSLALGFYFRTRFEFHEFVHRVKTENEIKLKQGITPLFHIENNPPADYQDFQKYVSNNHGVDEEEEVEGNNNSYDGNDDDDNGNDNVSDTHGIGKKSSSRSRKNNDQGDDEDDEYVFL